MTQEPLIKGSWPLTRRADDGSLLWHIAGSNPPEYAPDELLAMDFRTPITERASKRRADCRAAIDALQHPTAEQSSFLEAA